MYHTEMLRSLARDFLKQAKINLRKDGHLVPVGIVFGTEGLVSTNLLEWKDLDEKRLIQSMFRQYLIETRAKAALVINECWIKLHPDQPLDLEQSVKDIPGREEAIVIEARSASGQIVIIQPFEKKNKGRISFKAMTEFDGSNGEDGWSEFLDGVWDRGPGGADEVKLQ